MSQINVAARVIIRGAVPIRLGRVKLRAPAVVAALCFLVEATIGRPGDLGRLLDLRTGRRGALTKFSKINVAAHVIVRGAVPIRLGRVKLRAPAVVAALCFSGQHGGRGRLLNLRTGRGGVPAIYYVEATALVQTIGAVAICFLLHSSADAAAYPSG